MFTRPSDGITFDSTPESLFRAVSDGCSDDFGWLPGGIFSIYFQYIGGSLAQHSKYWNTIVDCLTQFDTVSIETIYGIFRGILRVVWGQLLDGQRFTFVVPLA